jgi:hypothetical protein
MNSENEKSLNLSSCPEGYWGHYTVSNQDSLAFLAGLFGLTEEDLLKANPHITSPDPLEAGTKIHIPGLISFPAGIIFTLTDKELPFASGGGAFIHLSPEGGQSVSVIATLPTPSYFGNFDLYLVEVLASASNIFEGQLFATPDDPPSWAARVDLPFLASLSPESEVVIRPFNSVTGNAGQPILRASLAELPAMNCETSEVLSITSEYDSEKELNVTDAKKDLVNDDDPDEAEVFDDIEALDAEISNIETEALSENENPLINETGVLNREKLTETESEPPRKGIIFDMAHKLTEKMKDHLSDQQASSETEDLATEDSPSKQDAEPGEEPITADTDLLTEEDDHSKMETGSLPEEEPAVVETQALGDGEDQPSQHSDEPGEEPITADTDLLTEEEDLTVENDVHSLSEEEPAIVETEALGDDEDQPSQQSDLSGDEPITADTDLLTVEEDLTLENDVQSLPEEEPAVVETEALGDEENDLSSEQSGEHEEPITVDADSLTDNDHLQQEQMEAIAEEETSPDETESMSDDNSNYRDQAENITAEQEVDPVEIADSATPFTKPVLNLDYNSRKSTVKYTPYSYKNKNRVPVNIVLNGTAETKHAIGVASIQLLPSQLIIAALKLPDPASLGEQYNYYTAWLIDAGNSKTTSVNMKKMLNGCWVGQSSSGLLKALDLIIITAETTQNAKEPTGPEVLIGTSA